MIYTSHLKVHPKVTGIQPVTTTLFLSKNPVLRAAPLLHRSSALPFCNLAFILARCRRHRQQIHVQVCEPLRVCNQYIEIVEIDVRPSPMHEFQCEPAVVRC